jgi:hypothetical protein
MQHQRTVRVMMIRDYVRGGLRLPNTARISPLSTRLREHYKATV